MCTCTSFANVFLAPLVAALFVLLVLSGNVFAARRKTSECKPNLRPLETHQLYSRLISCTRKISTLHLEFKCVRVCEPPQLGGPRAEYYTRFNESRRYCKTYFCNSGS